MGHIPHPGAAISGADEISKVCGSAKERCMIAMGDWNRKSVSDVWSALIGGTPRLVEPVARTCCYPAFLFAFDHTATNIDGAHSAGTNVYGAQLTRFPSGDEHKPVSVFLQLPTTNNNN